MKRIKQDRINEFNKKVQTETQKHQKKIISWLGQNVVVELSSENPIEATLETYNFFENEMIVDDGIEEILIPTKRINKLRVRKDGGKPLVVRNPESYPLFKG